jgi:hypothetical protein
MYFKNMIIDNIVLYLYRTFYKYSTMKTGYVYKITNPSNRVYIGSTSNIKKDGIIINAETVNPKGNYIILLKNME